MPNLNKVMLMGNLTRDPELRYTPNNTAVTKIGLAVNRRWRNQQTGEQQEETTFVDCTAFGRQAELLNQYMKKGRPLFIEGRLSFRQWQAQDGTNRSKLEVVIEQFQFIDSGGASAGGGGGGGEAATGASGYQQGGAAAAGPASSNSPGHEPIPEDDIPF